MRIVLAVIFNPASHGFRPEFIQRAREYFELHNHACEFHPTERRGHACELVCELLTSGRPPTAVIGMGGDGTLNEIVQSLAKSDTPLGIIPTGTTNVMARDLGIPLNIEGACEIIISGNQRKMPLGIIELHDNPTPRFFLLMCGIGWDGIICKTVSSQIKKTFGKGAYALETFKSIVHGDLEDFDIQIQTKTYLASTMIASVTAHYAGSLPITPNATPFDEEFQVFILKTKSRKSMVELLGRAALGKLDSMKDIVRVSASEIAIRRPEIPVQVDGDYVGETPANIRRTSDSLKIIYPANS